MTPNFRLKITLLLDESGNVGMSATSKDPITNLAILEIGKAILLNEMKPHELKPIVVPNISR